MDTPGDSSGYSQAPWQEQLHQQQLQHEESDEEQQQQQQHDEQQLLQPAVEQQQHGREKGQGQGQSESEGKGKRQGKGTPPARKGGKGKGKGQQGKTPGKSEAFIEWSRAEHQHRMNARAQLEQIPVAERPNGWWAYFIDYDGQYV